MHILLIHQYFLGAEEGGGSRFNEMTRFWVDAGHKVTVIAGMVHYTTGKKAECYRGKFIVKERNENGVTIIRCHVSSGYNSSFAGRLIAYLSFVFSSLVGGLFFARERYELILATSPPLFIAIPGIILSRLKSIQLVFEVRDLWPESAVDAGVLKNPALIRILEILERWAYRSAVVINTLTPAFRRKLIEEKGVPADKVVMVPNAADFSIVEAVVPGFDRESFRREYDLEGRFVIVYVGAHGLANRLMQLVDAAEKLRDTTALLLCIGDGMEREMLIREAQKRQCDNIRFIGQLPKADVFRFILASDAGTSVLKNVPTFRTVYSNKTFDYMACRKPVLMGIDGVSRELVESADCGRFVEPENPAAFSSSVRFYLDHPGEVRRQGENGYRYAKVHFDRQRLASAYLEVLQKAAG